MTDYYGNAVPNGLALDVGAHDAQLYLRLVSPLIQAGHFNASYVRSFTRTHRPWPTVFNLN